MFAKTAKSRKTDKLETFIYFLKFPRNKEENYSEVYQEFRDSFLESHIEPPAIAIHKKETTELKNWINKTQEKSSQKYQWIVLRRGIFYALQELSEMRENLSEKDIVFNFFIKKYSTPKTLDDFYYWLMSVTEALEYGVPKSLNKKFMRLLWLISNEWEGSQGWGKQTSKESRISHRILKQMRNWTAHKMLPESLQAADVAYAFILAVRGWLNLNADQLMNYEKYLLNHLFHNEVSPLSESATVQLMKKSYWQLRKKYPPKKNPRGIDFSALCESIGIVDATVSIKIQVLYQLFIHELGRTEMIIQELYKGEENEIQMSINFDFGDFPPKSQILSKMLKGIYLMAGKGSLKKAKF